MPKILTMIGMFLCGALGLIFLTDLAIQFPFGRANLFIDVIFLVCAGALGYLSWATYKEQI